MELRQLWNIARRRWWLIAIPALAALAYATMLYMRTPQSGGFSTSIRFTAAEPPADVPAKGYEDSSYYPWLASEYVVNALTDWVRTGTFAQEVSDALNEQGEQIPAGSLAGHFSADNARSVMLLNISWHDDAQLAKIADAATYVLQNRSGAYFPQVSQDGLRVVALDTPGIAPVAAPLSAKLNPLIRVVLGLVAGISLAFLVEYLDPSLHDRAEVESLGLPVIAEIPK